MLATDRIIRCEQGSAGWWWARRGKPSASNFDRIITPGGKASRSSRTDDYMNLLLAERLMDGPPEDLGAYMSKPVEFGINTEPQARSAYSLLRDVDVEQVGFYLTACGRAGCSPDGLVGDDGGMECKCPLLHTHIGYMRHAGALSEAYRIQVHGSLAVTGRKWWDIVSYAPGMPLVVERVEPDDFTAMLALAVESFCDELDAAWAALQAEMPEVVVDEADTGPF